MNRKIIIVEGYLASGKSTFARQLSGMIHVPCLVKDTFKSALCEHVPVMNRRESSLFSAVTFDAMMYVTERMCEAGYPVMLEGNFVPAGVKAVDEAGRLKQLIDTYGYTSLDFKFSGDTKVLYQRFMEREQTSERGQANKLGFTVPYSQFDQWCHNFDDFNVGGKVIKVDTTDFNAVEFGIYNEAAREFISHAAI